MLLLVLLVLGAAVAALMAARQGIYKAWRTYDAGWLGQEMSDSQPLSMVRD